jgi:hypothetical protein
MNLIETKDTDDETGEQTDEQPAEPEAEPVEDDESERPAENADEDEQGGTKVDPLLVADLMSDEDEDAPEPEPEPVPLEPEPNGDGDSGDETAESDDESGGSYVWAFVVVAFVVALLMGKNLRDAAEWLSPDDGNDVPGV